jgi:hypothetical protein
MNIVAGLFATVVIISMTAWHQQAVTMQVYKTPSCGCCGQWVEHLRVLGFIVKTSDVDSIAKVRERHGVPKQLASCHTAIAGEYVIEGHVPAADIQRLLKERPSVIGISVPGMPIGSPGMEVQGSRVQPYDVIAFDKAARTRVFSSHR